MAHLPEKPSSAIPKGPPPTALGTEDLTVGTGAEAPAGRTVGQAFSFPLGAGRVIAG